MATGDRLAAHQYHPVVSLSPVLRFHCGTRGSEPVEQELLHE